jgi:N6-adenosine-specific RNA methylase IME4
MTALLPVIPQSVPAAKRALAVMERDIEAAETYEQITRIGRSAEALKLLFHEVKEVREHSERVIIIAKHRIGIELQKVPKATYRGGPKKAISQACEIGGGREATSVPKDTRCRAGKLATVPLPKLKHIVAEIHANGKEASEAAVLRELKGEEIRARRAAYEARAEAGATVNDLAALAAAGKRLNVIYADPPWPWETYSARGRIRSCADHHYGLAAIDEIKALPVEPLTADHAVLLLWGTWPQLPNVLGVISSWGFTYKTCGFAWLKQNAGGNGLHIGMGYWTRSNSEICLLATKGSPTRLAADVHQVVLAPVGKHSAKPEEVRRRIERLFAGPYLELYGRRTVAQWTVWGNEIQRDGFRLPTSAAAQ